MSVARTAKAPTPGYSGKPLAAKLGLAAEQRVVLRNAPPEYWELCAIDSSVVTLAGRRQHFDFGHVFADSRAKLARELASLVPRLEKTGMLWISWPKKSAGMATDLTEDVLRELALPLGIVDVKVCALTDVWSGLKFMWRRERR
jgi:hypothetical protein